MSHLHADQNNRLTFEAIVHYLREVSERVGLSTAVIELLLEQFEGLKLIFGDTIPKDDVLRIISHQIELTRTGKVREPVDIVEFVESVEYMNLGAYVRPMIMEHLILLHDPKNYYYEVVLGGGIGAGKNFFADTSMAYDIYKLSCLYSPQSYYELAPGSKIVFIHQSKTEKLAKEVVFDQFGNRLEVSGYFPKYFPPDPKFRKVMKFPNNIEILPISSADTSALGMNVFGAVIDEMNFMKKVKKSVNRRSDDSQYDQAEVLYRTIIRRMESRFERLGRLPGKLYLLSSANYKGDFIDRKEEEAKINPHIFVMHLAQWESFLEKDGTLNKKRFCGKFFFVRVPTERSAGALYDEAPAKYDDDVIQVPVEYKQAFDRDLIGALRDIAGVAVTKTSRFISVDYVNASFDHYESIYGKEQIFKEESIELPKDYPIEELINYNFLKRLSSQGPFAAHIDLGISGDCAGLAIGHAIGSKVVDYRLEFDPKSGEFQKVDKGSLPIYGIPGILQAVPPKDGEIEIFLLRNLLAIITDYIPIYWFTMDKHQSASTLQYFRGRNISTGILSVDQNPEPYMEAKFAIKEERAFIARSEKLAEELPSLDQDNTTGKVDHPEDGSKDLADSLAAVLYNLSFKKSSYRFKHSPKVLSYAVPLRKQNTRGSYRPSSGRQPLY